MDSDVYWNMEKIRIREATEKGYAEVEVGGVFDASYLTSKTRRGRVQEGGRFVQLYAPRNRRYTTLRMYG